MFHEWEKDNFTISTNPDRLDVDVIHDFLVNSYWARGIPREVVLRSIENSLCFGLFDQKQQIGFARITTDYTLFAYLADVFILEAYRGRDLGKWLIECIVTYPALQGVRRILLATSDAHAFYRKIGFKELSNPEVFMEMLFERPWFKGE